MSAVLSRRRLLQGGGALLIALSGGAALRASASGVFGTGPASRPWERRRAGETPELRMVGAAILASNPHNSQPWPFRAGERQIDLLAGATRGIGTLDPPLREMPMGLGCALTTLTLAAQAEGFAPSPPLLPTPGDPAHGVRGRDGVPRGIPQHRPVP